MKQLREDIKTGNFRPVYLLTGPEAFLRVRYRNILSDALVPPEDTMNRTLFEGAKTQEDAVCSLAGTVPFFSERRLIILQETGFFRSAHPKITELVQQMPSYLTLIFAEEEVDKRSSLYKAVVKQGREVVFTRQSEATLKQWAGRLLADADRKIRESDMEFFLQRTGEDMNTIFHEADKLIHYTAGRDVVEREDILAVVTARPENRIFDMIRAVTDGRRQDALSMYADLLSLKEAPLRILALLARTADQIVRTDALRREGVSESETAKLLGVPPFAVRNYRRLLARNGAEGFRKLLADCAATEEEIKTGRLRDRTGVELLLLGVRD